MTPLSSVFDHAEVHCRIVCSRLRLKICGERVITAFNRAFDREVSMARHGRVLAALISEGRIQRHARQHVLRLASTPDIDPILRASLIELHDAAYAWAKASLAIRGGEPV